MIDILKFAEDLVSAPQQMIHKAGGCNNENGFTVILDNSNTEQAQYHDAPLFYGQTLTIKPPNDNTTAQQTTSFGNNPKPTQKTAPDRASNSATPKAKKYVPEQIRRMKNLYQYGNGSFKQICKNFYVQGKFMENYEDNVPWKGEISTYYWSTYHNLSLAQLRGYFTWRTELRKGNYRKHCETFVSMYLYELLNGIGTKSVEDSLRKMEEFETGYIDSGFGDKYLRDRLHRWMLEFAVLKGLAPDIARKYADSDMLEKDATVQILHYPEKFSAQEVFNAFCVFGGKKTAESKLIQERGTEAITLFAAVWRLASVQYQEDGKKLFQLCFGRRRAQDWHPLEYTLYYDNSKKRKSVAYELNPSRSYLFKEGAWYVVTCQSYYFNRKIIADFLHETDRRLRLYLKIRHPLKERKEAAWAVPYIEAVIEADRKAKIEAARPKISIDFSGLDKIRKDALETQGNLLTEEETMGSPEFNAVNKAVRKSAGSKKRTKENSAARKNTAAVLSVAASPHLASEQSEAAVLAAPSNTSVPLDDMQMQLLRMLLRGEPVLELIAAQRGMPSVIADAINEALFDLIGDTVVECDGKTITLVEDYRDDIIGILG
ncbi:TerB N-terminal domain-containing protein [Treponema sp. OMZ 855]|uniref:TerB N-terminal domain-containing protein n=1 Tax=Treponema sp. OMZ 855 TaxID=1643512 RepID=UPI0020A3DBF2|nr:TerB N-terminal domain-containing protein [Treponema sp. OMZ 855]UTC50227.1 TerB N-terminal domain-containing protein [Treponema sp. OMZ 855]